MKVLFAILCTFIMAAQVPPDWEVAPWLHWKSGVVTYSFDDGCGGQLTGAIPALNKYGLKGTFNLVVGNKQHKTDMKSPLTLFPMLT